MSLWKKNNFVQHSNAEMTSSHLFLLPSDSSSLGCRGANLLLRGDGPWAAGGLCHRLVCLQLGDERHLGGWGVDGGLVCDQQVKWRRFCPFFLHTCPWFSAVFVLKLKGLPHRQDTTKVDHAIPQRDHWALPYFSCQVAALTGFLSNNINSATEVLCPVKTLHHHRDLPQLASKTVFPPLQMFCYLTMSATSVTFLLMWEHSHYVLFIQGLCLFLLDSFDLVPPRKVTTTGLMTQCSVLKQFYHVVQTKLQGGAGGKSCLCVEVFHVTRMKLWTYWLLCVMSFVALSPFGFQMADINKVYLSSLILAYLLQFQNVTLLTSPLLSLLIGSVLARYFQVKLRMFEDSFFTFSFHSFNSIALFAVL